LALLTLFALVGISFVLYAQAEATAARVARESESLSAPDAEPELLLAYFLGQLIYDVDDARGVYSALRGHGLARLAYGNDDEAINDTAFNGTGRLHTGPGTYGNPFPIDDYLLVNYTYYPGDGFLHDPERLGWRAGIRPLSVGPGQHEHPSRRPSPAAARRQQQRTGHSRRDAVGHHGRRFRVTPASTSGITAAGRPWSIRVGSLLTVDSGSNQETVRVLAITPTSFTAVFTRSHARGFRIVGRGNPGPRSRYNPADDPEVVPYYSIIN
jgi:hypothetical protein